jgi:hypothetical protein
MRQEAKAEALMTTLDQLWFKPLFDGETIDDRAESIETLLRQSDLTWDKVLEAL